MDKNENNKMLVINKMYFFLTINRITQAKGTIKANK